SALKESVFNVLQFDIIDKIFIESFAGSGSIGLEAISRGAKRSYFIELDKNSYSILVRNCKSIDIEKCQTIQGNAFVQTPLILDFMRNSKDEIILYVDPPFDYREGMDDIYEKSFHMIENIEADNIFMIIIEHVSKLEVPQTLGKFSLDKTRKFGKSSLSYFTYTK
ncbi:RsmD family RNA methyltransferase, partial [Aliarcobacter butzleri]